VSLTQVITQIENFFSVSPDYLYTVALFRIGIGLILFFEGLDLVKNGWRFYSDSGFFPLSTYSLLVKSKRFSLFFLMRNRAQVTSIFALNLVASLSLAIGFLVPLSSLIVLGVLVSRRNRNPFVTSQGHSVATLMLIYLIFSRSGELYSLDSYFGLPVIGTTAAWPLRLMQIQMSIIYYMAFVHKTRNEAWVSGTVLFHVFDNTLPRRTWPPTPSFVETYIGSAILGWITIATQFALAFGLWIDEIRYPLIAIGALMHLSMELYLGIRLFQYIMVLGLLTFIPFSRLL
jgi:hypothetical protein